VDVEYQKLISRGVTTWPSLYRNLPTMLQLYPASNSSCISIDKPTVVLKRFFWKLFERILFTLRHLQAFVVAF